MRQAFPPPSRPQGSRDAPRPGGSGGTRSPDFQGGPWSLWNAAPQIRARAGLDALLPSGGSALRRAGGLALLGCSLWLVSIIAFFRAVAGLFS